MTLAQFFATVPAETFAWVCVAGVSSVIALILNDQGRWRASLIAWSITGLAVLTLLRP